MFKRNVETDNQILEQFMFSQKLNVLNEANTLKNNQSFSPKRERNMKHEEKVAFFLNNHANSDHCLRPPTLANEIIITHSPPAQQLKRLTLKDAAVQMTSNEKRKNMKGIQTDEKPGYRSTDVSTTTEITPLKSRPVQKPPPVIMEESPKKKKKILKKKSPAPRKKSPPR